jgi:hypothetical protein
MLLSEKFQFIPVIESADYGSAGEDGDSINMGKVHHVALAFSFGALTGNSVLKFYSGATAGTKTTALAFRYRLGAQDYETAASDTYGALTAVTADGLTLTATTFDHRSLIVEFDSADMTADEPFLTVEIDDTATVLNVACLGIAEPRYPANTMATALS